jgi:hypothetical protein
MPSSSSSSSEIPAIAPGIGDPENDVKENTDEDEDENGAPDDRDGVEASDVDVDEEEGEGEDEGEDCRCDALRGGCVVQRARFLGGDRVNRVGAAPALLIRSLTAIAISRHSCSRALASARAARSAARDDGDDEDAE